MTRGRARIHLDASTPGQPRRAMCGWIEVDTETDASKVTCKSCLSRIASKRALPKTDRVRGAAALSAEDVQRQLAEAFRATLAPTASAPPRITVQSWAASCKGGEHRRCGECEICEWEREAQLWAAVSPWNRQHTLERPEGAPRWSSLSAALVALAEFERHDRHGPSALGGILDRVKRGAMGDGGSARPDDPLLRRAGELVRIRQSIEQAYPEGRHVLPAAKCRALLMLRTPGVVAEMPTYEALSALFDVPAGELQALVKAGRRQVADDLSARGLIPLERGGQHRPFAPSTHYTEAAQ